MLSKKNRRIMLNDKETIYHKLLMCFESQRTGSFLSFFSHPFLLFSIEMFQGYQQLEKRYSKSPDGGNEFRSNMNINGSQLRSSGASRQKNKNLPKLVKQCWLSNPVYRERDGAARGGEG